MESDNLSSINWIGILVQWVYFFALLTAFFFPAFKFSALARGYNKKGWVYFIVGLVVGVVGFYLGFLVVFPLRYFVVPKGYVVYLSSILFLSAYISYRFAYKYLQNYFTKVQ